MKKMLVLVGVACALSACNMQQRAPSTELNWSCYKSVPHKYHKDMKPEDGCGLCPQDKYSAMGCVPGANISDGSRMYPNSAPAASGGVTSSNRTGSGSRNY